MYHYKRPVLALVLLALCAAPSFGQKLEAVAAARVLVGHQTVGQNVLDGAAALAAQNFVGLKIEHALVGKDGAPLTKLVEFAALVDARGQGIQVALLELSYADVGADTDVEALFSAFKKQHDALKIRFAGTRFVVVTVGLTTVGRGLQGLLKNKLASGAFGERGNVKRHQFNELLRTQYAGNTPVFDLAAVEAGSCAFEREGKQWPCLREELTDDGGHLNALGRKEAGRAFIDAAFAALSPAGK